MIRLGLFSSLCTATLVGCGGSTLSTSDGGAAGCQIPPAAHPVKMGTDPRACSPDVRPLCNEGQEHRPLGEKQTYATNPPASGRHWSNFDPKDGVLAPHPWGVFLGESIAREQWIHNLEHGGIVFLENCGAPGGDGGAGSDGGAMGDGGAGTCPDTAELTLLHDEKGPDAFAGVLVTLDPLMPRRVAAVAWEWVWTGDAIDMKVMRCFRDARYAQGPESP